MEAKALQDGPFLFVVPGQFEIAFEGGYQYGAGISVYVVADNGVSEMLHVYADLVGAAGMDAELYEGIES